MPISTRTHHRAGLSFVLQGRQDQGDPSAPARIAISAVLRLSRISPYQTTSGSWRRMDPPAPEEKRSTPMSGPNLDL